ncbi:MAG: Myo-inositol-phosphate synthase [Hyphomicrobiales bacterium]|nr:Myo-inositol-phosphate synthase [Hyphomicrobiales bacterium]
MQKPAWPGRNQSKRGEFTTYLRQPDGWRSGPEQWTAALRSRKIRVALVGIGNCASSLVQGLTYYSDAPDDLEAPGLMNVRLGAYHVRDIEIVAAFDVNALKVGRDVADAIFAPPNNTFRFASVAPTRVMVQRGPTHDGLGKYLREVIEESREPPVDVVRALKRVEADVVVSYLPVGSQIAAEFYAHAALDAGCAFVNCMPVFIASRPEWRARFEAAGLPVIGDDIKSQVGATIVHRILTNLFRERGVRLDRTYQLNFGGNSDFQNMLERERLESKKISKTQSVMSQMETPLDKGNVHVGPSDYVEWLTDRKWAYIRMEGTGFGGAPLSAELKLEVWDSPNSAGIVIDAIRCARIGLDRRLAGALNAPSAWFMKSPPVQVSDAQAHDDITRFINEESAQASAEKRRAGVRT